MHVVLEGGSRQYLCDVDAAAHPLADVDVQAQRLGREHLQGRGGSGELLHSGGVRIHESLSSNRTAVSSCIPYGTVPLPPHFTSPNGTCPEASERVRPKEWSSCNPAGKDLVECGRQPLVSLTLPSSTAPT